MILHTIINPEEIFYKAENKKSSEMVCITNPFEYIRNDEYSKACNILTSISNPPIDLEKKFHKTRK